MGALKKTHCLRTLAPTARQTTPADAAKLKACDQILKIGNSPYQVIQSRKQCPSWPDELFCLSTRFSEPEDALFSETGKYDGLGVVRFQVLDIPTRVEQEQGPAHPST